MNRILIAGIGNMFLGDDGFGVEVARRIEPGMLPPDVAAVDYGIRGVHLAYDLLDGDVEVLIMVDALPTGDPPGTVTLLELDEAARAELTAEPTTVDSHAMNPQAVIAALHALGGRMGRIFVVGCQPLSLEPRIGLSPPVAGAVEPALGLAIDTAARFASQPAEGRGARARTGTV